MKILYIGNLKNKTTQKDIEVLSKRFNVVTAETIEKSGFDDITHVIQYCNPKKWKRYGTMKHIGHIDYFSIDMSPYINIVDEIWGTNLSVVEKIRTCCSIDIERVPHSLDTSLYKNYYRFEEIPEISGTFSFFCSSIDSTNEDLKAIISSFWSEFDPTEPVSLILKSSKAIGQMMGEIKNDLNLYKNDAYQKIILIDDELTIEQELSLHQMSNCYINISNNNNWPTQIFHAIGYNKQIISNNTDYLIGYKNKYIVKQNKEEIMNSMRKAYNQKNIYNNEKTIDSFDELKFLNIIKEVIK